jgi:hypothetical protein
MKHDAADAGRMTALCADDHPATGGVMESEASIMLHVLAQ